MAQPVIIDTDILIDFSFDRSDAVNAMTNLEDQFTLNFYRFFGSSLRKTS